MGRHRLLMAAACSLGLLFTLSGCVKLDMDLTVKANDTVEGTIILAVDKRVLTATGQSEQQLQDQLDKQGPFPAAERPKKGKFSQHRYDKDGKIGEAYDFSGVPLSEFGNTTDGLKITHKGDRYFVAGHLDLTGGSASDPETQALAKKYGSTPELRIKLTFPGEMLKSNGEIDGRSVTWHPRLGQTTELTAEARSTAVIPKLLAIAGGVVGLLLVIGLILLLLVLRRRRRARAAYATPAGYPAGGYDPAYQGGYGGQPPAQPAYWGPAPAGNTGSSPWQGPSDGYASPPPGRYDEPSPWQPGGQVAPAPWQPTGEAGPAPWQQSNPNVASPPPPPPPPGANPPSSTDRTQVLPVVDPTQPVRPDEPGQR
ncbi:MAG: hypothetical protein M3O55_11990 [Actinomycetota bacterium]|nr:hypothetical protein [Actinomycetota bacterium]